MADKRKRSEPKSIVKRKKAKDFYCAKDRAANKGYFKVPLDASGVLVACRRGCERKAAKELVDLFTQYADEMYPAQSKDGDNDENNDDNDDEEEEDFEASIAKELSELKAPQKNQRVSSIHTDVECLTFIKTKHPIQPVDLVHRILSDLERDQKPRTRYTSRLLPVQKTCLADTEKMQNLASKLLVPVMDAPAEDGSLPGRTYAVMPRVRRFSGLERKAIIDCITPLVAERHRVDLDSPDYTIIVEICENVCMMSVVPDWNRFKKYNIESILGTNDAGTPRPEVKKSEPKKSDNQDDKQTSDANASGDITKQNPEE
ncbi:hypothetical protein BCR43DRAFT_461136 [Syncephalastrum racemosum]|uniref:THUMP domain-containing protein n=1 Tax=Syncephalastrum racemosum TaxID=13706 RepID=A0A1X2H606_SYNRA|nr:hypothetical protein BCR43DRAFT_461136 [Syncephalastrum racemosum]